MTTATAEDRFTARQALFLDAYFTQGQKSFLNATGAARAANYRWPNKVGPRLARMPHIHDEIERRFKLICPWPPARLGPSR